MKFNPHPFPYKLMFLGQINLKEKYWHIRQEAENLAEKPENIINRSVRMHSIYQDSKNNYRHAEMVSHGGLWAYPLFNFHKNTLTQTMGALFNPFSGLKEQFVDSLKSFCEGLQNGNRTLFVESATAYYFSKLFGREPGADKCLEPGLLNIFNEVHTASKNDTLLPEKKHKDIFSFLLNWEQQLLDPIIKKSFDNFNIPILRHIALYPWVGLSFIPKQKILLFRNFNDRTQRIQTGSKIYDIASKQGWDKVSKALILYKDCPRDLECQSSEYQQEMHSKMLKIKTLNH